MCTSLLLSYLDLRETLTLEEEVPSRPSCTSTTGNRNKLNSVSSVVCSTSLETQVVYECVNMFQCNAVYCAVQRFESFGFYSHVFLTVLVHVSRTMVRGEHSIMSQLKKESKCVCV